MMCHSFFQSYPLQTKKQRDIHVASAIIASCSQLSNDFSAPKNWRYTTTRRRSKSIARRKLLVQHLLLGKLAS